MRIDPSSGSRRSGGGFLSGLRRPGRSAPSAGGDLDWRTYDPVAEDYARVLAPRTALVAADVTELLGLRDGDRVLDVGTGTGAAARRAAGRVQPGGSVVGVDLSFGMLRAASRDAGVRYAQAAAIDLPFRNGSFDAVTALFVLSHFARYETALYDILRVLRSAGRLGVATWAANGDEFSRTWDGLSEEFAERSMLQDAFTRAQPWADRFTDRSRLTEVLHDAGLRDMRAETRTYHFQMSAEDYLVSRETSTTGRFLHEMLGDTLWERFRGRSRQVFAERFPPVFNDFRDAILVVGVRP
jgi:ubiquinone/menaquinone biosynthesis C-methylase UbiE